MDEKVLTTPAVAWQPLTFRGVAAFAAATWTRLALVQLIVALAGAAAVGFYFRATWKPAIQMAIDHLPGEGKIEQGQFSWSGPSPSRLGEGTFVSFVLNPENAGELGQTADVEWIFNRDTVRIRSILGHLSLPYPRDWKVTINEPELRPWWGAWQPTLLAAIALVTVLGLEIIWAIVAAFYSLPLRLIAFYGDRDLPWAAAWRLGAAALLPGALFLSAAIVAYTLHRLNLLQLLAAIAAHLVIGWVFLLAAPAALPRSSTASSAVRPRNPFMAAPSPAEPKTSE